jgi:GMP synthase (glutamine-hydrolysing)
MKTAAVIRHVPFEDLGAFASALQEAGYAIRYHEAGTGDLRSADLLQCEILFVLGGPIGAYEEDKYPFLCQELSVIESRLASGRPILGICLGAQLMARALGSRVYPGPAKEIGWAPIALSEAGRRSPVRHLESGPVLHWHGDTFDLPSGAELLVSTDVCRTQAFAYGKSGLAFQFHPEAEAKNLELWFIGHAVEISGVPGLSVNTLRADTARFAPAARERGLRCFSEWLAGLPAQPGPAR